MKILRAIAFLLLMIVMTPLCFAQGGGENVGNGGNVGEYSKYPLSSQLIGMMWDLPDIMREYHPNE